jgi:hypothetical protein
VQPRSAGRALVFYVQMLSAEMFASDQESLTGSSPYQAVTSLFFYA